MSNLKWLFVYKFECNSFCSCTSAMSNFSDCTLPKKCSAFIAISLIIVWRSWLTFAESLLRSFKESTLSGSSCVTIRRAAGAWTEKTKTSGRKSTSVEVDEPSEMELDTNVIVNYHCAHFRIFFAIYFYGQIILEKCGNMHRDNKYR